MVQKRSPLTVTQAGEGPVDDSLRASLGQSSSWWNAALMDSLGSKA